MPLFTDGPATDAAYINIRDARDGRLAEVRAHCEALWVAYEEYADHHFREQIRSDFSARHWEMYLTVSLMDMGFIVSCPKPGPDVGIEFGGQRIWFEAISPKPGSVANPDRIQAPQSGVASTVPNDRVVLRYLAAVRSKYFRQYTAWLENGTVAPDDCFVIAINPRELPFEHADTDPPRILQTALPLGHRFVSIDRETLEITGGGHQYRAALHRASGAEVPTGAFLNPEYVGLSGLLCSRVDAANRPVRLGDDFQLVPNPMGRSPLPATLRLRGTYFRIEVADDELHVTLERAERDT